MRDLFIFLKREAKEKQIFITTHSPIFVDGDVVNDTWIFRKEGLETKVLRAREFRSILDALGASPKDRFFPDKVLLVEGDSDKAFLSTLAERVGNDLTYVRIVPIWGKSKGKYNLDAWEKIVEGTQIPLFLMLDQNAKKEVVSLVRRGRISPENYILLPGDIEDSYPLTTFIEVVNEQFGLELSRTEMLSRPRVKIVEGALKKTQKHDRKWKVIIAEKVAQKMQINDIPKEIQKVLEILSG